MTGVTNFGRLFAAGLIGVVALAFTVPLPPEALTSTPLTETQLRLVVTLQSSVLLALMTVLGLATKRSTGFVSWIARANTDGARAQWSTAALICLGAGLLGAGFVAAQAWLMGNNAAFGAFFANEGAGMAALTPPPIARFLYGGITEEILLRWGIMGALAWALLKVLPRGAAIGIAVILSAGLFAAGHLPAILAMTDNPSLVFFVFTGAGNMLFGVLFGLVFWRLSLEAAMLAHMAVHVGFLVGGALLGV